MKRKTYITLIRAVDWLNVKNNELERIPHLDQYQQPPTM